MALAALHRAQLVLGTGCGVWPWVGAAAIKHTQEMKGKKRNQQKNIHQNTGPELQRQYELWFIDFSVTALVYSNEHLPAVSAG